MPSPSAAEEHLRVIRSLMEKATIYRAISAQAALVAGIVACVVGFGAMALRIDGNDTAFICRWFGVLAVSAAANLFFLHRDARRRGEQFISPGMRTALRAMIPPLFCGAVIVLCLPATLLVPLWMIFYGLALLSTAHFAPRSLARLGLAFVALGLVDLVFLGAPGGLVLHPLDLSMALTFGLLHIVYAAFAWSRSQPVPQTAQ